MSEKYNRTEPNPSPLDALKHLAKKQLEPVKHIQPKKIYETEDTPHNLAQKLIDMAKDNAINNVGRVTLSEARFELADKTLQIKDLIALINQYAPAIEVEPHPGNTLYLKFGAPPKRSIKPAIPQLPPKHIP
jgi:hypothetical protein